MTPVLCNSSPISQKGGVPVLCPYTVGLGPRVSCQNCMLNVATDWPLQSDHYIRPIYVAQPYGIKLKVCYHELSDIHADTEIIVWLGPHSLAI